MGKFFKDWRRKVGCGLLLVAMIFLAGWMRSTVVRDYVGSRYALDICALESDRGEINLIFPGVIWRVPYWLIVLGCCAVASYFFFYRPQPSAGKQQRHDDSPIGPTRPDRRKLPPAHD